MITYKRYVKYNPIDNREFIENWLDINDDTAIYSNRSDYRDVAEYLLAYKEQKKRKYGNPGKKLYRNIWGHNIIILLPFEFHEEAAATKFVKEYMIQLHRCYKSNSYLYCFKLFSEGNGVYADILCFTRKFYSKPLVEEKTWNSDYYWNPLLKRRTTKCDPNSVLLHKKGDLKLDKDGNKVIQTYYVSQIEERVFEYNRHISKMGNYLRSLINDVRLTLLRTVDIYTDNKKKYLSYYPNIKDQNGLEIARTCLKNKLIKDINTELARYQDYMYAGGFLDNDGYWLDNEYHTGWNENIKSFWQLIYKIDQKIRKNNIFFNKKYDRGKIEIYVGSKQTFASLRKELNVLKSCISSMLEEWWNFNVLDEIGRNVAVDI